MVNLALILRGACNSTMVRLLFLAIFRTIKAVKEKVREVYVRNR